MHIRDQKKQSFILNYFSLGEDSSGFAVFHARQQSISRGGKTTNFMLHLSNKPEQNFQKYEEALKAPVKKKKEIKQGKDRCHLKMVQILDVFGI